MYVDTSIKRPGHCDGSYIYVLEYITKSGQVCTISGAGREENVSRQRLELTAILTAAKRIGKTSAVRVITPCGGILAPVKNGWLEKWEGNGWKNGKNEPVHNADLWQQLAEIMKKHTFSEEKREHAYGKWMETELKRMEEKKNTGGTKE